MVSPKLPAQEKRSPATVSFNRSLPYPSSSRRETSNVRHICFAAALLNEPSAYARTRRSDGADSHDSIGGERPKGAWSTCRRPCRIPGRSVSSQARTGSGSYLQKVRNPRSAIAVRSPLPSPSTTASAKPLHSPSYRCAMRSLYSANSRQAQAHLVIQEIVRAAETPGILQDR